MKNHKILAATIVILVLFLVFSDIKFHWNTEEVNQKNHLISCEWDGIYFKRFDLKIIGQKQSCIDLGPDYRIRLFQ